MTNYTVVRMMSEVEIAKCVLWFHHSTSVVTVQYGIWKETANKNVHLLEV